MANLKVIQGAFPGKQYDLETGRSVMGRSPDCEVVLDVAAVSRRHAVVTKENDQFFIEDMGSRNGTFVNGQRVVDRTPLRNGDQVLICDMLMEFQHLTYAMESAGSVKPMGLVGPGPESSSLLGPIGGEDGSGSAASETGVPSETGMSTIMATLDVGTGNSSDWQISAKPEAQLMAIIEIANNLSKVLAFDEILPKLLDSLFKIFVQADRGFVIMRPKPEAPLVPVASKARRVNEETDMRISRTVVQQAVDSKQAILSADAASDERFNMAQSIADFQIRSLICAPMLDSDGKPLGVIQIDTRDQRSRFTDQDLRVLVCVANQAAIALDNAKMHEDAIKQRALQRDLELARKMQQALLPAESPDVSGYHFFDFYESALQVGGDYYDYVLLADDRFAVVVGDVAGKGVSAGILMAKLSSDVRFWLVRETDAAKAMNEINAAFSRHAWDDRFVTMVVAVVDPHESTLTLVNAGHMPPLLRNSASEVLEVGGEQAGLPLGVIDDYQYESYQQNLVPGDLVTIFTDGFSEAMNSRKELFGLERLIELASTAEVASTQLGPYILSEVRKFAGDFPQSDDMCLVCFGRE
jgi:sigma-B regulation protein RsbU (phosphoserine phosphatase)